MSSKNGRGVKNAVDGIFISANGEPMTQVNSDALGDMAYDATIRTMAPRENPFLPGTNQVDPSSDQGAEYLPARMASSTIASEVLSNGFGAGDSDPAIEARMLARRRQGKLSELVRGFQFHNVTYPLKNAFGMMRANVESKATRTVFSQSVKNQPGFIQSVENTELAITNAPLLQQINQNVPVGNAQSFQSPDSRRAGYRLNPYAEVTPPENRLLADLRRSRNASRQFYPQSPIPVSPPPGLSPFRNKIVTLGSVGPKRSRKAPEVFSPEDFSKKRRK